VSPSDLAGGGLLTAGGWHECCVTVQIRNGIVRSAVSTGTAADSICTGDVAVWAGAVTRDRPCWSDKVLKPAIPELGTEGQSVLFPGFEQVGVRAHSKLTNDRRLLTLTTDFVGGLDDCR
jgi:hypothetical protein